MMHAPRPVGTTDLRVTPLSLGGSSIGNIGSAITDDEAFAVMEHARGQWHQIF